MSDQQTLAMLEKRRIEAGILKHVYETLKASHGVEVAKKTIAESVRAVGHGAGAAVRGRRRRQDVDADLRRPAGAVDPRRRARDAR